MKDRDAIIIRLFKMGVSIEIIATAFYLNGDAVEEIIRDELKCQKPF
jgi:hypothetical protein